ncbi:MAG: YceI family protein [Pseudomonadales bacterium]|nr:YceI family protein [Pseudomonadales bacterium]
MNMIDSAQKLITTTIVSALLASLPLSALGDWKLVSGESDIAFATIKNSAVVESHTFERFSGEVTLSGAANIRVDLASVETRIPIRNERMGTLLFNIDQFPSLDISSKLDIKSLANMEEGASTHLEVPAKINLHGTEANILLPLVLTRLSSKRFQVVTTKPVIAYASQFGLTKGVEALRLIAQLATITPAVPVTFSLIFEQAG